MIGFHLIIAQKYRSDPQARVLELVGVIQDRELTAALLDLNDQMNNQLLRSSNRQRQGYNKQISRFERYKNNSAAERGPVQSPGSSDEAFSPDEVMTLGLPAGEYTA